MDHVHAQLDALKSRLAACADDRGGLHLGDPCKQAIRSLLAGCGTADLHALATTDRVTESCKASLWALLPARDSHRSRVLVMGTARTRDGLDVYVAASDEQGEPAPLETLQLALEVNGRVEIVDSTPAAAMPSRCEAPIFAASSILDYSGSMSDRDLDESIEIFRTLYAAVPDNCLETDVLVFSDDVRRRGGRLTERGAMMQAVVRDPTMPRGTTALVDALGDGARSTSKRPAPVRMLLVATDGKENASKRWSYADALRTAQAGGVRIISFGSLLSDVDFLERLGAETGGFFLYRADPRILAAAAQTVGRLLASTRRIHIVDARLAAASHVIVEHGTQRERVAFR